MAPSTAAHAGSKRPREPEPAPLAASLSPVETQRLLRFYEHEIARICGKAGFDRAVMATSTVLFKRFYLSAAPEEFPPAVLVYTAIFAGIKVESCPYTELEDFCRKLIFSEGLADDALVLMETPFLQGLKFHLMVYHPYRPLKALLMECIQAYTAHAAGRVYAIGDAEVRVAIPTPLPTPWLEAGSPPFITDWDGMQARAHYTVDLALTCDAPLLFAPSQIALACLLQAAHATPAGPPPLCDAASASVAWFVTAFVSTYVARTSGDPARAAAALQRCHDVIDVCVRTASATSGAEAVKPLLERLEETLSPAIVTGTEAYRAKLAASHAARAAYKASKRENQAAGAAILAAVDPHMLTAGGSR